MQIVIILRKNFKYNAFISTFSEYITIFRTLSIDIWQLNVNNDKQIKKKWKPFQNYQICFLILLREATLESKIAPTNLKISAFLIHTSRTFSNVELFSIFQPFMELYIKNVAETISCFIYQLSKKYCVYYVSEHLKIFSQINEYCLLLCSDKHFY